MSLSHQLRTDLGKFAKDRRQFAARLRKAFDGQELLQILKEFDPTSLRLVVFCLNDCCRAEAAELVCDDGDGRERREFQQLNDLVERIVESGIARDVREHCARLLRGNPIEPGASVRPAQSVQSEAYLREGGELMIYMRLLDADEVLYEWREPIAGIIDTAKAIIARTFVGVMELRNLGVEVDRLPKSTKQATARALVDLLRKVRECCNATELVDWDAALRELEE